MRYIDKFGSENVKQNILYHITCELIYFLYACIFKNLAHRLRAQTIVRFGISIKIIHAYKKQK